jgi:hypothetical protein
MERKLRCDAITQKGTRCKLNALEGDTKCTVHGGVLPKKWLEEGLPEPQEIDKERWKKINEKIAKIKSSIEDDGGEDDAIYVFRDGARHYKIGFTTRGKDTRLEEHGNPDEVTSYTHVPAVHAVEGLIHLYFEHVREIRYKLNDKDTLSLWYVSKNPVTKKDVKLLEAEGGKPPAMHKSIEWFYGKSYLDFRPTIEAIINWAKAMREKK